MSTERALNYGGRVVLGYVGRVGSGRGRYSNRIATLRRIIAALDAAQQVDYGDGFGARWRSVTDDDGKVFTLYVEART